MSMIRPVAAIGGATLLSRLLGFARDIAIAGLFGAGARADAFFVSLQIVNLARRLFIEGALNAAFVPLYLQIEKADGERAAQNFAGRLIGTFTLLLLMASLLLAAVMPLLIMLLAPGFTAGDPRESFAIEWARLMLPYLVFAGPAALIMALLNAERRFAAAAWAAAIFNVAILLALAVIFAADIGDSDVSGRILAASVAAAGLCQLLLVSAAAWHRAKGLPRPAVSFGPQTQMFFRLAIPGLIAAGIPQLITIVGAMAASASPSAISWLYYAQRLVELPLGIVSVAIGTVLIPTLSHALTGGEQRDITAAESRGLELAFGLSLPAAIALAILSEPIVRTLFERGAFTPADSAATATALVIFALGLPGHVLFKTWAPLFFARGNTRTPMLAGLCALVAAGVGSVVLMPLLGHIGVAIAVGAAGWVSAGVLAILIHMRIGFALEARTGRRLSLIALAALVMGGALGVLAWLLQPWFTPGTHTLPKLAALGSLIACGIGVYGAMLMVFKVARWSDLKAILHRSA